MTTKEITIYQQTNKNGVLHLYCESCKPRGGKRGMLVTGSYDHCCQGCGESFLEKAQDVPPEPEIGDKVRIHGVGFGSGATGKVVSQVFHEQSGTTTRYCLVELPKQGSIAFSANELQIIPLVQCPRCQCLVYENELKGGCPICGHPEPEPPNDDEELSPSDITAIEKAMSQPDLTYTVEELARLVEQAHREQKPSAIMLTGLFDAPCSRCHLPTRGRCQECNVPLCMLCVNTGRNERMVCLGCHVQWVRLQQAWEQLQATASYVEAQFA